jgi:hypothetical protein
MTGEAPKETIDVPFLVTASELRDRKIKRRRERDGLPGKPEASDLFRPSVA